MRDMHWRKWLGVWLGLCLCSCGSDRSGAEALPSLQVSGEDLRPNILLLYLDDLGYNDLGSYSSDEHLPTSALDALAREGVQFTRHYADSTCSPARAALLTGRYPARFGYSPNGLGLSPQIWSLPKELKRLGYTTHHVGKWHLGHRFKQAWPDAIGFDTWFGFLSQWLLRQPEQHPYREDMFRQPDYWDPWLNDETHKPKQYHGHLSDILTKRTVELIKERRHQAQPWFINHWFYQPHTPLQPHKHFARKYPATSEGRYLAVLEQLDHNVGRIIEALESTGQLENTLIVVASDNGGTNRERDNNWPFYGKKADFLEGGLRTPLIIKWPSKKFRGQVVDVPVSTMDLMPTILAIAGGQSSDLLDGRDLTGVINNTEKLGERALFWEARHQDIYNFGILSENGEWRVQSHMVGGPPNTESGQVEAGMRLYSLNKESRGETDVVDRYPQVALQLLESYISWFRSVHRVALTYEAFDNTGRGLITGDDFQRTPGGNAFAWVIGVKSADDNQAQPMTIVEQEDVWSVRYFSEGRQLKVELGGKYQLKADLSSISKCQSLLITGDVAPRLNHWSRSKGYMNIHLYVDGKKMDSVEEVDVMDVSGAYANPTYIGQNSQGEDIFSGILSKPLVYNVISSSKNYLPPAFLHHLACAAVDTGGAQ